MKVDLPYVFSPKGKAGRRYHYYRRDGQRVPIVDADGARPEMGSAAFLAAYTRIHATFEGTAATEKPAAHTIAGLIDAYKASPDFKEKADKTRRDYGRYLDLIKDKHGKFSVTAVTREFVFALRDKYAATPRTANYIVQVLRLVLTYAEDRKRAFGLAETWSNPARKPKLFKRKGSYRPWLDWEIDAFRKTHAAGAVERVAFELALNTGQRAGDLIAMDRRHYHAGWISVASQEKTGARVDVPASQALRAVLDPWLKDHDHLAILVTATGAAFKIDHFRHTMRTAYDAAGLDADCHTHGLRHTAAVILNELGCDWEDVGAVTGHETAEQARAYMRKRGRAKAAVTKLDDARAAKRKD